MLYKAKGYSDDWIEKRMRGIAIREELTNEWKNRDIREQREYEILTAEIFKTAFDMTPSEYKKFKGLKRENLRDHINPVRLLKLKIIKMRNYYNQLILLLKTDYLTG